MKTIKFDCRGHNAPAYSCNKPYDNSGEYVPADVAQGLYDALRDWLDAEDHPGAWMSCRDQAKRALAAADGEDS